MFSPNHFLLAANLLMALFHDRASFGEIAVISLVFGVLVDLDLVVNKFFHTEKQYRRSFIQEPLGIFIVGFPLSWAAGLVNSLYFWMALTSYVSHVCADYLTVHQVRPWAPLSKKSIKLGLIKPIMKDDISLHASGFPERYVLMMNLGVFSLFAYLWY